MPRQHKGTEEKWVGGKRQFSAPIVTKTRVHERIESSKVARRQLLLEGLCEINRLCTLRKSISH
jgi:hypothetical protein